MPFHIGHTRVKEHAHGIAQYPANSAESSDANYKFIKNK